MRTTIIFISFFLVSTLSVGDEMLTIKLNEIPVTGNPLNLSSEELVTPIHIINGDKLSARKKSSLGDALNNIPGISNSSWGESIGRPVIRGLDNNRVMILNNGMKINDVSSMSGDHSVSIDTLSSEQIEIIRGPASVIYGGGAIGGVINIIDSRIHENFYEGMMGRYDAGFGGANNESSSSFLMDYGIDNLMIHVSGYKRDSKNLKIPGFSVSKRLNESDSEFLRDKYGKDTLNNSYNQSGGGSIGISHIADWGYTGFSFSNHQMKYGNPIEDGGKFDLNSDRYDFTYEVKDIAANIDKLKVKLGYSDYEHQEIEPNGDVGSEFLKQDVDSKFEMVHSLFGTPGVVGMDLSKHQFSKSQGAAFIANNRNKNLSLYFLEDFNIREHKITLGFRQGYDRYDANDFISDDGCTKTYSSTVNCGASGGIEESTSFDKTKKTFYSSNISLGTVLKINSQWSWLASVAHSQRAPAYNELYAYGHHHATETIEQGDRSLKKERSNGIDTQIKWQNQRAHFSFGPYYTRFNSYIALLNSGETQNHLHEGEDDSESLSVYKYQNIPAEFIGFEMQGGLQLSANYALNIWSDYVRAKNKDGGNLPRIPPLRLGGALTYKWNGINASANIAHSFNQSDIASNELKTDNYTNVSLSANYKLPYKYDVRIFIKVDNLLNEEKRDHTSFLKDKTLMGERAFIFDIEGLF